MISNIFGESFVRLFFYYFYLEKCTIVTFLAKKKKYGIPLYHFDQFELKSSCTVDIRSIRRSVENTITMDTRENFDEKARTNIPDGDLHSGEKRYSIVRNRWDYSQPRKERQISLSCFHHRYFPRFFFFLSTYISPILPSINVHFPGTIIKSREKVPMFP